MAENGYEQAEQRLQQALEFVADTIGREEPRQSGSLNAITSYAQQLTTIAEAHRVLVLIRE